jgi:flavin reductase (DIM6/NTAB) family NADH-FMN oxidoreductase RutF
MTTTETTEATEAQPGAVEPPTVAPAELRKVLGNFATGVTVVTSRREDGVHGITVNSFTSVSLDPPLVLIALGRGSRAAAWLDDGPFVINGMAVDQQDVAMHFAGTEMPGGPGWIDPDGELPRLSGTVGHLICTPWRTYDGGDHLLHLGHVEGHDFAGGEPLVFFRGRFPGLEPEDVRPRWLWSMDDPENLQPFAVRPETD